MYGDASSWTRFSNVDRYAQDRRIAVVTCSAGNNFYQNLPGGLAWETFFTRELPAYIHALFPVSGRREDTFIGGFSMGGYGAWHLALSAPEVFSKAASMSGALDIVSLYEGSKANPAPSPFNWKAMFGDPDSLAGSGSDLFAQYEKCAAEGCVPELYQTCGTEDFLYPMNLKARDRLLAMGANLTYTEGPGAHDWNFWDQRIQAVLDWMLKDRQVEVKPTKIGY
jgi:S-formylglutathione hydrolase FrmB